MATAETRQIIDTEPAESELLNTVADPAKSLGVRRYFTIPGRDPFDEIEWEIEDKNSGAPRAKVLMKAGDVAAMPADIRHQGHSRKRSMLLVWENATPGLPEMYDTGKLKPYPIEF